MADTHHQTPTSTSRGTRTGLLIALALALVVALAALAVAVSAVRRAHSARAEAERLAYAAGIAAAAAHLAAGDLMAAAERLAETPASLRRWEWGHLLFRVDENEATLHAYPPAGIAAQPGRPGFANTSPGETATPTATETGTGQGEVFWWDGEVVHVWERKEWTRRSTRGYRSPLLAVDDAGRRAVAQPLSGKLVVVDLVSGAEVEFRMAGANGQPATPMPTHVIFSAAGDRVFMGTSQGAVRTWDTASGAELPSLIAETDAVKSLAADEAGIAIAVGYSARPPVVIDTRSREVLRRFDAAPAAQVLDFSGGMLVTGGPAPRLWNVATGQLLKELSMTGVNLLAAAIDAAGMQIATGGTDRIVRVWDIRSGQMLRELKGHTDEITRMRFSADGAWLLTTQPRPDHVRLWSVRAAAPVQGQAIDAASLSIVSFGGDKHLCGGGADGHVRIWKVLPGRSTLTIPIHDSEYTGPGRSRLTPPGLRSIACSADGSVVATAGFYDELALWSAVSGERRAVLDRYNGVRNIALSGDGTKLAAARFVQPTGASEVTDAAGEVGLFDTSTRQALRPLTSASPVYDMTFSHDGRYLYGIVRSRRSGSDAAVRRWRLDTGAMERFIEVPDPIFRVRLSPDGRRMLAVADAHIHIIDTADSVGTASGRIVAEVTHEGSQFIDATFLGDASRVVSMSSDGSLRLWDASDGALLFALRDAAGLPSAIGTLGSEGDPIATFANAIYGWRGGSRTRPDLRQAVKKLFARHPLLADVETAIRADIRMPPKSREAALVIARQVGENPYELLARSARVTDAAAASAEARQTALRHVEAASRIAPWDAHVWLTLAGARYRVNGVNDVEGATQALAKAETLQNASNVRFLAWKAMILHRVGDAAGARESLDRARTVSAALRDQTAATVALLAETEALIAARRRE